MTKNGNKHMNRMEHLPERKRNMLGESLLGDVEIDDAEDEEEAVHITLRYECRQYGCYVQHLSRVIPNILCKSGYVRKVARVEYHNKRFIDIDFIIDDGFHVEQFCVLLARMFRIREIDNVNSLDDSGTFEFNVTSGSGNPDKCCLSMQYDYENEELCIDNTDRCFFCFFHENVSCGTDTRDEDILRKFCHSFATESRVPISTVKINSNTYYMDERKNLSEYRYVEGFAVIKNYLNTRYTFIDKDNKYLIDDPDRRWFFKCYDFHEGFAVVVNDKKKMTYIDAGGKYLIDSDNRWFDACGDFNEGCAKVKRTIGDVSLYTYIDSCGKYLIKDRRLRWLADCRKFKNGFARVKRHKKYGFINRNGEYVTMPGRRNFILHFENCADFSEGLARVKVKGKFTFMDSGGNVMSRNEDSMFDSCSDFKDGCARVSIDGKWTYIDTSGKYLIKDESERWFEDCRDFTDGLGVVSMNSKQTFIDTSGRYLIKDENRRWFDYIGLSFCEGFIEVRKDGLATYMDRNGEYLIKNEKCRWFDKCGCFGNGIGKVMDGNGKFNYVGKDGNLVLDNWFDDPYEFMPSDGLLVTGEGSYIDQSGEYVALI